MIETDTETLLGEQLSVNRQTLERDTIERLRQVADTDEQQVRRPPADTLRKLVTALADPSYLTRDDVARAAGVTPREASGLLTALGTSLAQAYGSRVDRDRVITYTEARYVDRSGVDRSAARQSSLLPSETPAPHQPRLIPIPGELERRGHGHVEIPDGFPKRERQAVGNVRASLVDTTKKGSRVGDHAEEQIQAYVLRQAFRPLTDSNWSLSLMLWRMLQLERYDLDRVVTMGGAPNPTLARELVTAFEVLETGRHTAVAAVDGVVESERSDDDTLLAAARKLARSARALNPARVAAVGKAVAVLDEHPDARDLVVHRVRRHAADLVADVARQEQHGLLDGEAPWRPGHVGALTQHQAQGIVRQSGLFPEVGRDRRRERELVDRIVADQHLADTDVLRPLAELAVRNGLEQELVDAASQMRVDPDGWDEPFRLALRETVDHRLGRS